MDVDAAADIAERFTVTAMPTFLFIRDGEVVQRFAGASVEKLSETINSLL